MLQINQLLQPQRLEEAYQLLQDIPGCVLLGGCGYLRLGTRKIETALDLSDLGLDFIHETDRGVEIGAMTSLRELETSAVTSGRYRGLLARAVENIVGIQLRNIVTIGGSVAGRYPFSDPITALMALDCTVVLHHHGEIELKDFLENKPAKDILVKLILPGENHPAAFVSQRRASSDYPVLNVAASRIGDGYRVVVGSRPGRARNAVEAADLLRQQGLSEDTIRQSAQLAADSLSFGDNPRGSARYRKAICPVLVERALTEVMHAA